MTRCAVIDIETNTQVNFVIAEVTDNPPFGCKLVEIPNGHYWDGKQISKMPIGVDDGN
jgi:hypothetical protein